MRARSVLCLSFFVMCLALARPLSAEEPFSSPLDGARRVVLGYGDPYEDGGAQRVHRGLDLAGDDGATVRSCTGGKVTFAGLVPASGEASRTLAVTVAREDGIKTTYMPLADAAVKAGGQVEAGEELGTLARDGDASSASPHLHLSVRRGDAYLDPAAFLAPVPPPAPEPEREPAPAPPRRPPARSPQPSPAAAPAASPAPAGAGAPHGASSPVARAAGAGGTDSAPHALGSPAPHAAAAAPPSRAAGGVPRAAHAPVSAPAVRAASAASAVASKAAPAAASSALAFLGRAYGGARRAVTALAELLVASALLWPVWRSVSKPLEASAAVVPARVRE